VQEFKAYVEEAHEKQAAASSVDTLETKLAASTLNHSGATAEDVEEGEDGSDDEEGEGDDDGELDYTTREVVVVEDCVKLLGKALGCIKHTLQIATAVCDTTHTTAPQTVFAAASGAETGLLQYSEQWVAQLAHLSQLLKKDVLDLGAELYPPFEKDTSAIEGHFATLREHCLSYLRLTDADALRSLQTAEHTEKIAQLLREVEECAIRS
jgi:hypothetical protein